MCGLSYREYRNKDARIDVLTKLFENELPLDAVAVQSELTRLQIDVASLRSAQQKAKLLLEKMHQIRNGVVHQPAADTEQVQRQVQGPSADDLAKQGRYQVEKLMFQEVDECTETMDKIWRPRRKVSVGRQVGCDILFVDVIFCMCQSIAGLGIRVP